MALQHREQVEILEDTFKENEMKYVTYQGNSSEVITSVEKMKKCVDQTVKAMENAHNTTYEMKIMTDEMKIKSSRKKDEMERLKEKLEDVRKQVELDNQRVSELNIEINKISIE